MSSKPDPLAVPPVEVLREIERRQNEAAERIRAKHAESLRLAKTQSKISDTAQREKDAAEVIQRNYRGYRARRAFKGYDLDPSTRWVEALKDAKYRTATKPYSREETFGSTPVKRRWQRARTVAYQAGEDHTSDESEYDSGADEATRAKARERRRKDKAEREKYAKVMGLEYFLEMVDQKHRYGSNLRRYHQEWKASDTRENFFYWLDEGEGKDLDLEDRPRKRLDTEQVRYLSREERRKYLVEIDTHGRFCWAKDGRPVHTSADFKDSIEGIVKAEDPTPSWREVTTGEKPAPSPPGSSSSSSSSSLPISPVGSESGSKYGNDDFHNASGVKKLTHLNVDALMNHLLRKTTKKNTWIFVADTSFRLYIGIKQSGAFQHSSFLKGARISAAGLIKIKHGQIRQLSPLSGHYAPPVKNFRQFIKTLRERGADLSRLNVSRSYAVILGLEGYIGVKKSAKNAGRGIVDVLRPEEKRKREEKEMDKSKSAERERMVLEMQRRERRSESLSVKLMKKLGIEDGERGGGDGKEVRGAGERDASLAVVEETPPGVTK